MARDIDQLIRKAQMAVENLAGEFEIESERSARQLRESWSKMGPAPDPALAKACFRIAHDIKGQSATFGYSLLTDVANSLCRLLQAPSVEDGYAKWAAAVTCHVDAVELITARKIKGDGGKIGAELLAALQVAVGKHEGARAQKT